MKLLKSILAASLLAVAAHAQTIFSFADIAAFGGTPGATTGTAGQTIVFVGNGFDAWFGELAGAPVTIPAGDWALTGNFNGGNNAALVSITIYNTDATVVLATADFALSLAPSTLVVTPSLATGFGGAGYITVAFDGAATAGTVTLDNFAVTAIPEPSHVALGLGAVALLGAVYLRRRKV